MSFEFATATRIIFGAGTLGQIGAVARQFGKRALIVTGRTPSRASGLNQLLGDEGIARWTFAVPGEPTTDDAVRGARFAREEKCDLVVGFGGGSAIDAAKAIAALMTNDGEVFEYLEVIGNARPLSAPPAPFIAVPTTAGAGAEVTRNAVLASPQHRVKASLRSPLMLAKVALVDPELTFDLPPAITATTGLDALTQLIEPYVSCRANPLTDAICAQGIRLVARSLRRVCAAGSDSSAREDMAAASLMGGLALANAGLGAVHGFAAPLGGMFFAPHGAVCAALLPGVMRANLDAVRERAPGGETAKKYDDVARFLTGNERASASDGVAWVEQLCADLHIPPLRHYGITANDFPALIENAAKASSMKANPIVLTAGELKRILERAL